MTIGERIRQTRKAQGMTQKQVAELCGMADSAIRKYESGSQKPKLETLCKIANALNVSPSFLAGLAPAIDTPENRQIVDNGLFEIINASKFFCTSTSHRKTRSLTLEDAAAMLNDEPSDEDYLLMAFDELNEKGRRIAIERVEELSKIPEYQEKSIKNEFSKAQRIIHGKSPKEDVQEPVDLNQDKK